VVNRSYLVLYRGVGCTFDEWIFSVGDVLKRRLLTTKRFNGRGAAPVELSDGRFFVAGTGLTGQSYQKIGMDMKLGHVRQSDRETGKTGGRKIG